MTYYTIKQFIPSLIPSLIRQVMPIPAAPALLIGIGARIFIDTLNRTDEPAIKHFILVGIWQGIALHYALRNYSALGIPAAFIVAAKLIIEFNVAPDILRCSTTILGVIIGALGNEFLTQFLDTLFQPEHPRKKAHTSTSKHEHRKERRERLVQFHPNVQGGSVESPSYRPSMFSDITSVDSNSELIKSKVSMTPLEREIAALRARASLADSERRRYKEEKKWAISQGNVARAAQMKWQVKRYTALMQSFHKEADAKVLEASAASRARLVPEPTPELRTSKDRSKHHRPHASSSNDQLPTPTSSTVLVKERDRSSRPRGGNTAHPSLSRVAEWANVQSQYPIISNPAPRDVVR